MGTELDPGSGGDTIQTINKPSISAKVPSSLIDLGGTADVQSILGDSGVTLPVGGLAAENAAVLGNPVLVGARYDASPRTLGDGDVGAIALDADGAVHISDGGNVITVDGTVTANLSATDNAVLDDIAAWTSNPAVAAEDAAAPASVIQIGGRFDSSARSLESGDVGAIAIDAAGFVKYTGHVVHGEGGDAYMPSGTDAVRANMLGLNFNGVTWDRIRGDATNGLLVNLGTNNDISGTVTANAGTGTFTVSAASLPLPTGAATAANQSTGNSSLSSIASSTANITTCNTGAVTVSTWSAGTLTVDLGANNDVSLNAGTNAIGKLAANSGVDIGDVDVTSISAGSNLIGDVSLQPRATGGLTMSKTTSAASTNATSLKASAGQVYSIQCFNVNAAVRYLKLYNKASAPTVGTDTPVKTLAIPGNTAGAGFVISWPQGLAFGTGIAFALTTEATDAGTTGVAADEITVNIDYK